MFIKPGHPPHHAKTKRARRAFSRGFVMIDFEIIRVVMFVHRVSASHSKLMKRSGFLISGASRLLSTTTERDFFGINHVTSKDIGGVLKSATKLPSDQIHIKYHPLERARMTLQNKEKNVDAIFATIRFDDDNVATKHGQFEPGNEELLHSPEEIERMYLSTDVSKCPVIDIEESVEEKVPEIKPPDYKDPYKMKDVNAIVNMKDILELFKQTDSAEFVSRYANKPPLFFYFESSSSQDKIIETCTETEEISDKLSGHHMGESELEQTIIEAINEPDNSKQALTYDPAADRLPLIDLDPNSAEYEERQAELLDNDVFDSSIDEKYNFKDNEQSKRPLKASQYLNQIKSRKIEPVRKSLQEQVSRGEGFVFTPVINLDSKGFHDYRGQVPNWQACRRIDAIDYLRHSIVYDNYDILAVNKPYGIASHEEDKKRDLFDVNTLLQEVAKERKIEKVYLAHRLDKTTTGVLLFATSQERAKSLHKLFHTTQIRKTYWCITTAVPDLPRAIIDIPVGEFDISGVSRSCLVPDDLDSKHQLTSRHRHARKAITEYKVLSTHRRSALIEVKPSTGVKHQIRCHLSFGINCPILGDHKYSHIEKLAPQVLPAPTLKLLKLRQQKVRTLPMHLHAKSIVIPNAKANGETLFIHAPLPAHFSQNLRTLQLNVPVK